MAPNAASQKTPWLHQLPKACHSLGVLGTYAWNMAGKATSLVVPKSYLLLPFSLLFAVGMGVSQVWQLWEGIPAPFPPIHPLVNSTSSI